MERKVAEEIFAACERALASLNDVEVAIWKIAESAEQAPLMHALSGAIVELMAGVRAPVVRQYPEMNSIDQQDAEPYVPSNEEIELMHAASEADASAVDALILRECTNVWQKVAKIVGNLIPDLDRMHPHLPIAYIQARMDELEDAEVVEIVGDVWAMRYSEIRLRRPEADQREA